MAIERRLSENKIELREDTQKVIIQGYAALFDEPTIIWDFEEVIAPNAFSRALRENQDVRALFNHDSNYVLGRTKNGTLRLREDNKGLWIENEPPNSPIASSIVESIRRGDVDGQSFAFTIKRQEWQFFDQDSGKRDRRTIMEIGDLYDVGPVTYPAYQATSIKLRNESHKLYKEARARWEEKRVSVQVPESYAFAEKGMLMLECRSADGEIIESDEIILVEDPKVVEPEVVVEEVPVIDHTIENDSVDREIELKKKRLKFKVF
jgi:HK97 family phage prohead protease